MAETYPVLSALPMVPARHFTRVAGRRRIRLFVVHDMEFPERLDAAEAVARYFATTTTEASAHLCCDANSIVRCVADQDVAWAAPGCNHDGLQLELAGYGRQTRAEWLDAYGLQMLARAADAMAQWGLLYGIRPRLLSDAELRAGQAGVIGHVQATRVYGKSDHTDPGPHFPWDYFAQAIRLAYLTRGGEW